MYVYIYISSYKYIYRLVSLLRLAVDSSEVCHPRFFDEQLASAVEAIDYVRGSGN